jgi:hypothetical protein
VTCLLVCASKQRHERAEVVDAIVARVAAVGCSRAMLVAIGTASLRSSIASLQMLPTLPTVACDSTVKSEISCAGSVCPPLPATAAATCNATCCTADAMCGTRSTATLNGQSVGDICLANAVPDARCPSSSVGGASVAGCCDALGRCGQLYGTTCLSTGTEAACDAPPSAADADE